MQKSSFQHHCQRFPTGIPDVFVVTAMVWLGVFGQVVSPVPPTMAEERSGHDPLSQTEMERVRTTVLTGPAMHTRMHSAQPPEELMIELHQETKAVLRRADAPRRADVVFYDYATESTIRVIVDVPSGRVEKVETVRGMQPLISKAEAARALAITLADQDASAFIESQYRAVTGSALRSAADLHVTAGVFHVDVMPDVAEVAECAAQRCTHLLLTSHTDQSLSAMPIVNLSRGRLLYLGQ